MKNKSKLLQQRVHRNYLLMEAEHFRDHKKGIPEWIKNSDDSYTRHEEINNTNFADVPILINFSKKSVTCLDFGGANSKDMIQHIPFYGSPEAATQGRKLLSNKVSGGHGNGGKYYALSQFKECKIISYYKGRLTVLRINQAGDYVDIENEEVGPWEAIKQLELDKWNYFESDKDGKRLIKSILDGKLNLFGWQGIDPKDKISISNRLMIRRLLFPIVNHPQCRAALRVRNVCTLYDGSLVISNMKPEEIQPDISFGTREFYLPNELENYKFNKTIKSSLKIVLSREPLTGDKSSFNILEIDSNNRNVAYYEIPNLMLDKGIAKYMYAHIDCPELKEYKCVSNDRVRLIENDAGILFLDWCKSKIKEVLEEIANKEKKKEETQHLNELGSFLKELTEEIQDLLEEDNLLKPTLSNKGDKINEVLALTDKPGFGDDGKIKNPGGGKRAGKEEKKDATTDEKKAKSKLKILLSNHDQDPLNPGKTFDMQERGPILSQRVQDVDYGIWWVNSQKGYVKKIRIKDNNGNLNPAGATFYFFLIKDILLSNRIRRRFKEQEGYYPDGLEEVNFNLIDDIFGRTVERLGVILSTDETIAQKIRDAIKNKEKFTINELSEETLVDPSTLHMFIANPANGVLDNFFVKKDKSNKDGRKRNIYIKK